MSFATTYSYSNRRISDLTTFLEAIRFIVINIILAFIIFFLVIEEFEWAIFSSRENIKDTVIDESVWNTKTLILKTKVKG